MFSISLSFLGNKYFFKLKDTHPISNQFSEYEEEGPKMDAPDEFAKFEQGIRTRDGETGPQYPAGYVYKQLSQAQKEQKNYYAQARLNETNAITWTERGPANVPGRTRAIVSLPGDATHNTWLAGSVGGGIWKTTNGGTNWVEKTKDLPNIAFSTMAYAPSNPDIIYAGSGEGGLGGVDQISGNGLFKSLDAGETWSQLPSTAENFDFQNINRVIVDPNDENILLICTTNRADYTSSIFKSIDGGVTWNNTYQINATLKGIQQIIATPGNFNTLYASSNGIGVLKSIDAGETWANFNAGMNPDGRIEIAVSPVNTNRVFASTEGSFSGSGSDLFVSEDAGVTWSLVNVAYNGNAADYLGGQGWYDHTILCSPFDENVVYLGGVNIFQVTIGTATSIVDNFSYNFDNTETFWKLNSFSNDELILGGTLDKGSEMGNDIEFRFGPGKSQFAHRFLVPDGTTSGVQPNQYTYQDYVEIPFEIWDITTNTQLMVSFRDQNRNGQFDLLPENFNADDPLNNSREYFFVENYVYDTSPNSEIAINGGQVSNMIFTIYPILADGGIWDPNNLPTAFFRVVNIPIEELEATTLPIVDVYANFNSVNVYNLNGIDVHPDQHNLIPILVDETNQTFRIIATNDGGVFVSNTSTTPGVNEGDWTFAGNGYNTSQFYGADKKPGEDIYFGGMQDNGTWLSPSGATAASNYSFKIGGDGFEVLWNSMDPNKLIGGSQYNGFKRSTDGGATFIDAVTGLSGSAPFISKLAGSSALPDIIYTVTTDGVFKSKNFGVNWVLSPIDQFWSSTASSFLDVEVSRANANIVWAGSGISTTRRLHVSTDQGATFTPTSNYPDVTMGTITKIATHPTEPNTAYALFSFARSPKILRTEDLGQTWTDISGFGVNSTSNNGFPDVAVYCLYVRPDDPNILWAGTDIGIVESVDNGISWHLLDNGMPKVAIWDMKGQDNQVVIATHGRGIWTATLDNSQIAHKESPEIITYGTSPQEAFKLVVHSNESFDSTEVWVDGIQNSTFYTITPGEYVFSMENIIAGVRSVNLISYSNGAPVQSKIVDATHLSLFNYTKEYSNFFNIPSNFRLEGLETRTFASSDNKSLQSTHNYLTDTDNYAILTQPIIVSSINSMFNYEDIALVEPGETGSVFGEVAFNDYVVVEGTKDGLNWTPIADGYNATSESKWLSAYQSSTAPSDYSLYVKHSIDLQNKFVVGDTLLFRFRLHSNHQTTGWGWSVDNLYIQTEPLGIEKPTEVESFSIYPNPTRGDFEIDYQITSNAEVIVNISDLSGRVLKSYELGTKVPGLYKFALNNTNLSNGIYLVNLKTASGIVSKRIVISQ